MGRPPITNYRLPTTIIRILLPVILLLAVVLLIGPQGVEETCAQGTCSFPRTCATALREIVGCPAGYDTLYYRATETADDNGDWGGGDCGGGPTCVNDVYRDVPDNSLYYRGFWIRMHDHNQDVRVHFRFGDWSGWTLVASEDVYSSGQACEEGCDDDHPQRTHPPGDQGCPDPPPIPGPTGWFTTLDPGWVNRGFWPCANSFAEHSMNLDGVSDVNRFWIRFDNDNAHVHVYDWILTACTVAVPSLNIGASCAGGTQRTVTWATVPGFQYQVQAARDVGFTTGLLNSGWIAAGNYTFNGLGHGLYYYRIRARDGAGRTGAWLSPPSSAEQDQMPPTTSATPSGTAGNAGWWRSNVQVALTAADVGCSGLQGTQYRVDGGGWAAYGAPFTVSGEGNHTVEFWSRDQAGNTEATGNLAVRIDTVPPATTASASCSNPGGGGWCRGTVTVNLAAADATSGVDNTRYRIDGGPWQWYIGAFAVVGDGLHSVEYHSIDVAGNQETVNLLAVRIDTVPPTTRADLSGTAGNAGWWRSNVQVSLAAEDTLSGVGSTQYRVDGGGWTAYSAPFMVSGEGSHTVEYRSTDVAGNQETVRTLTVRIDTIPPSSSITSLSDGQWVRGTVNVAGGASDATSGVAAVAWSRDNGATWQAASGTTSWSATWDTTAGPDGDYRLGSRADDVAGNQEGPTFILIHVDNTPPATVATPSGTAGNAGWWRSDVQVTLSASDGSGIGVATTQYRVDGGGWATYNTPFTVSGEGSHTVEYRSTDGLGNQETIKTLTVRIDTVPPMTTASATCSDPGNGGWCRGTATVSLAAVDATSGVGATSYRVDGGAWQVYGAAFTVAGDGIHTVEYRSTDVAGNDETARSLTVRVDTTPPTTAATPSGTMGNNGWWRSAVRVSLSALDATSGVGATSYRVDGGIWLVYTAPFTVTGEGDHVVQYRSSDVAGNDEDAGSLALRIDTVPPATTAGLDGPQGLNGWYTGTVTLTLAAADATSGVEETLLDGAPYTAAVTVDQDGRYRLPYFSTDRAGNVEPEREVAFALDTTPPLAAVTGGAFCPGCGERLLIRATGSDAMSGVCTWRLEVLDGATALRSWSGSGAPTTVLWDGRDTAGHRVGTGYYGLRLRVTDCAGWRTDGTGQAQVTAAPPPPPATATPAPPATPVPPATATATPPVVLLPPARTRTPTPTGTPRPSVTPSVPAPTPTSTPIPVAQVPPAPPARGIVLRLLVFEDDDADAVRVPQEPGLGALRVVVEGVGEYVTDASGLITVTLPGAGEYTFALVDRPGPAWQATTREWLAVRVGEDGSLVLLPGGGRKALPVGVADGVAFAFGLAERRVMVWLALTAAGLLFIVALTAVLDRRAKALRRLERTMKAQILMESSK